MKKLKNHIWKNWELYCWVYFQGQWIFYVMLSCGDGARIASFGTFLMKLRSRTLFMMYFLEKKIWQILIDFSTIFAIKTIGGSHIANIREKCAWWVQKSYFCALCVHIRGAYILPIYSPEYGDNPRYPNLEKIRRITDSACSYLRFSRNP